MTSIQFFRKDGLYTGFSFKGHAGQASEGENIVCAAISASVELTECQLTDVLKLDTEVEVDARSARVTVITKTPHPLAQAPIIALRMYMEQLEEEYPRFLKISEVSPC